MRKSQATTFLLLLFYVGKFIICWKTYLENLVYIVTFSLAFLTCKVIGNVVTLTFIQIFSGFLDVILRSKILGNRLNILTWILTAMDYFFYLYIPAKYLQFRKNILIRVIHFIIKSIRKGIKILIKRMFSFWAILINMKLLVILFMRKTQAFVKKNFGFTSNKLPDLLTAELFFKL